MEENILASSSTERIPLEPPWVKKLVISKFIIYLVFVGVCMFLKIIVDLQRCANFCYIACCIVFLSLRATPMTYGGS